MDCRTEQEIYEALDLEYREPSARNTSKVFTSGGEEVEGVEDEEAGGVGDEEAKPSSKAAAVNRTPPPARDPLAGYDVCYNCGGHGHWAKDCPSAPRSGGSDAKRARGTACYNCGAQGHWARD